MTRLAALAAGLVALDLAQPAFAGPISADNGALVVCSVVFSVIAIAIVAHQLSTRRPK